MAAIKVARFVQALELEMLHGGGMETIEFTTADINRPGLALAGFYDYFAADRLQVIGKHEMTYLMNALDDERRYRAMDDLFARPFPALVISRGMEPPQGMTQLAVKHNRPLFRSALSTNRFISQAGSYLNMALAPRDSLHGVLVDVYAIGVLITGESGMGKSETALELLRRGHRLVADDLVEVYRSGNQLIGSAPESIRHFMEIRGIGIINIRHMYGIGSVLMQKGIDMICRLEPWDTAKQYDRLGLEENTTDVLGLPVPTLAVPVIPGRNLAILIEVAARNRRLKNLGYNAAIELQRSINENDCNTDL